MIFILDVEVWDRQQSIVDSSYPVDLLRDHKTDALSIFKVATTAVPLRKFALGSQGPAGIPAALWPSVAHQLKKRIMYITDVAAVHVITVSGKRYGVSMKLTRVRAPRPPQVKV